MENDNILINKLAKQLAEILKTETNEDKQLVVCKIKQQISNNELIFKSILDKAINLILNDNENC